MVGRRDELAWFVCTCSTHMCSKGLDCWKESKDEGGEAEEMTEVRRNVACRTFYMRTSIREISYVCT